MLRTIKLGEADRIVTIFTQGHGKVRAVAKGIRKTTSKFGARLEPMSRVALQCYKRPRPRHRHPGRDARSEPGAARGVRAAHATRCRCSKRSTRSRRSASRTPRSTGCSRARSARSRTTQNPLVTPAFFWKLLSLEGFHPMLDGCARCGDEPRRRKRRRTRAGRVRSRRGRHRCAGRARGVVAGRSRPKGSRCCGGCSAAGSTARSPRRPVRPRTRSSSSGSARSSTTSSAGCGRPCCSDPGSRSERGLYR